MTKNNNSNKLIGESRQWLLKNINFKEDAILIFYAKRRKNVKKDAILTLINFSRRLTNATTRAAGGWKIIIIYDYEPAGGCTINMIIFLGGDEPTCKPAGGCTINMIYF